MATITDFEKLDIRVGIITAVDEFPEARTPAWKLTVDFGKEVGIKKSSARLTENYSASDLLNKKVLGVVNFPPRQIGPFVSEVLILGVPDDDAKTVLVIPEREVSPGKKLY